MISSIEAAGRARELTLATSLRTQTPHVSSALSCLDILAVLYHGASGDQGTHREIYLSKGHAALGLYAVLEVLELLPSGSILGYCADGSVFEGHVNSKIDHIPLSTGSLGHALPFALGRALGDARKNSSSQHWVVMSDGELDEGSNWEGFLIASHHRLSSLNIVIDRNRLQSLMSTEETSALEPLAMKLESFGWRVFECDGNDHVSVSTAVTLAEETPGPSAVIAHTIKGFGVADIEANATLYHYRPAQSEHLSKESSLHRGDNA